MKRREHSIFWINKKSILFYLFLIILNFELCAQKNNSNTSKIETNTIEKEINTNRENTKLLVFEEAQLYMVIPEFIDNNPYSIKENYYRLEMPWNRFNSETGIATSTSMQKLTYKDIEIRISISQEKKPAIKSNFQHNIFQKLIFNKALKKELFLTPTKDGFVNDQSFFSRKYYIFDRGYSSLKFYTSPVLGVNIEISVKNIRSPKKLVIQQQDFIEFLKKIKIETKENTFVPKTIKSDEFILESTSLKIPKYVFNGHNSPLIDKINDTMVMLVFSNNQESDFFYYNPKTNKIRLSHTLPKIVYDIKCDDKYCYYLSSTGSKVNKNNNYTMLYLNKCDFKGTVQMKSPIVADSTIKKVNDQVFDYYSRNNTRIGMLGDNVIIHFNTKRKWSDNIVHQAGYYSIVKKEDLSFTDVTSSWHVSHCFEQNISILEDKIFLTSVGDAYPRGVVTHFFSADNQTKSILNNIKSIFLMPIKGKTGENYVQDTHISNIVKFGNYYAIVVETEEGAQGEEFKMNDLKLIIFNLEGKIIDEMWITQSASIEDVEPKLLTVNDKLYVYFSSFNHNAENLNVSNTPNYRDKKNSVDVIASYNFETKTIKKQEFVTSFHDNYPNAKLMLTPTLSFGTKFITLNDSTFLNMRLTTLGNVIEIKKLTIIN